MMKQPDICHALKLPVYWRSSVISNCHWQPCHTTTILPLVHHSSFTVFINVKQVLSTRDGLFQLLYVRFFKLAICGWSITSCSISLWDLATGVPAWKMLHNFLLVLVNWWRKNMFQWIIFCGWFFTIKCLTLLVGRTSGLLKTCFNC